MSASISKTAQVTCDQCYKGFDKPTTNHITTCTHHLCLTCLTNPVRLTECPIRGCFKTIKAVESSSTTDRTIASIGSRVLPSQKGRLEYQEDLTESQKVMPFQSLGTIDGYELDESLLKNLRFKQLGSIQWKTLDHLFTTGQLTSFFSHFSMIVGGTRPKFSQSINFLIIVKPLININFFIQALDATEIHTSVRQAVLKLIKEGIVAGIREKKIDLASAIPVEPVAADNPVDYSSITLSELQDVVFSSIDSYVPEKLLASLKHLIINKRLGSLLLQNYSKNPFLKIVQITSFSKLMEFWIEFNPDAKASEIFDCIKEHREYSDAVPVESIVLFTSKLRELLNSKFAKPMEMLASEERARAASSTS